MSQLIFDAHLDLSMNAMEWNRDLTKPLSFIRRIEKDFTDKPDRGNSVISLEEMRKGKIGICVATQIARYADPSSTYTPPVGECWYSQEQARAQTQGQLAWYKLMEDKGEMSQIKNLSDLKNHLQLWEEPEDTASLPIGYILSLEGADSIINMDYLEQSYEDGLRAIGPAHYGPGVYAYGTDSSGGLGEKGRELLRKMERLNIILDTSHLCDESFWEALNNYNGPVWASHNNCRELVPHNRQYSDEQIKALIERDAVIGAAFDAWMLVPGWERGASTPDKTNVSLNNVVNHIDHICQIAGDSQHSALGTDLDGGFGKEQCPDDIETIADLQKIPAILKERGYSEEDIGNIMSQNWISFLKKAWED
jgi:membrane dipeptidase